jgi:MFS family permease
VDNIWLLLFSRLLMGVGLGMVVPFSTSLIFDLYEGEERTTPGESVKATALLSAMIYVGQFTAPPFQRFVGIVSGRPETGFLYLFVALVTLATALALFARVIFGVKEQAAAVGR